MSISGDNFPPGGYRLTEGITFYVKLTFSTGRLQAAQIFSICKILLILMVLSSFNPFPFFGVETPSWAAWMLENKIYACKFKTILRFNLIANVRYDDFLPLQCSRDPAHQHRGLRDQSQRHAGLVQDGVRPYPAARGTVPDQCVQHSPRAQRQGAAEVVRQVRSISHILRMISENWKSHS